MGVDSSSGAMSQMSGIRHYLALSAVKQTAAAEAMTPVAVMEQAAKNFNDSRDSNVPVSQTKGQKLDITI